MNTIFPENTEEIRLVNETLLKYREKRQREALMSREELIQECKNTISFTISDTITHIGLDETRNIIKEINTILRKLGEVA